CGHFLIPAFDMLVKHYSCLGQTPETAGQRAIDGLYGADIDAAALSVLSLSLLLRYVHATGAFPDRSWRQCANVAERMLGSLDRGYPARHVLGRKYAAVVTNPPYIGRKLMSREMKQALR